MKTNDLKNTKGITLIALVVSIIVILILAGVSIAVLTGENGILNRATEAKKTNEDAEIMENIRLAYNNAQIGKYAGKNESFVGTLKSDLEKVYGTGENNVKVVDNQNDTYTITIRGKKFTISANGNVAIVEDISISPATLDLQIVDANTDRETKTPKNLTAVLDGISGQISWEITAGSDKVSINPSTGETISVTPVAAGSATVKATCSGKSATCEVTITSVSSAGITFNANGGTFASGENGIRRGIVGGTIDLPAVPTAPTDYSNYTFEGWYSSTESNASIVFEKDATTGDVPANDITVYAKWKEPKYAFRSYGDYENTAGYGAIGTRVFLVSGSTEENPQTISVGNGTIQDNWKVFYEDSDFVYLIYGDYYPADVQTNSDCSTIQLTPNESYAYGVNSSNRADLLKYLRNNSGYSWISNNDRFDTTGTQYTSWNNLQTSLSRLSALSGKTIGIQGSADIDLWDRSWTASGNTAILTMTNDSTMKNLNGYLIRSLSGSNNVSEEIGYNNTIYFPHTSAQSTANGYWIASPGGDSENGICYVSCDGNVGCGMGYNRDRCCTRPIIAIEK